MSDCDDHYQDLVQNDTAPPFDFYIKNDDEVRDDYNNIITAATDFVLTDYTVRFIIKGPDGTVTNTGHQACDIIDALTGHVRYFLEVGDLAQVGTYHCDLEVTDVNDRPQTDVREIILNVRPENG